MSSFIYELKEFSYLTITRQRCHRAERRVQQLMEEMSHCVKQGSRETGGGTQYVDRRQTDALHVFNTRDTKYKVKILKAYGG